MVEEALLDRSWALMASNPDKSLDSEVGSYVLGECACMHGGHIYYTFNFAVQHIYFRITSLQVLMHFLENVKCFLQKL